MSRSEGGALVLAAIAVSVGCSTVSEAPEPAALTRPVTAAAGARITLDPVATIERCVDACRVVSHFWGQEKCFPIADNAAKGFCRGTLPAIAADGGTSSVRLQLRFDSAKVRYSQYWYGQMNRSSPLEILLGEVPKDKTPIFRDGFESGGLSAWSQTR